MKYINYIYNPNINFNLVNPKFQKDWLELVEPILNTIETNFLTKQFKAKIIDDIKSILQTILFDMNHFILKNTRFITSITNSYDKINDFYVSTKSHIFKFYSDSTLLYGIWKTLGIFENIKTIENPFLYWKFSNEKAKHYDALNDVKTGENKFFGGKNAQWFSGLNASSLPSETKSNIIFNNNEEIRKDIKQRWGIKEADQSKELASIKFVYNKTKIFSMLENDLDSCYFLNANFFVSYYSKICCIWDFFLKLYLIVNNHNIKVEK